MWKSAIRIRICTMIDSKMTDAYTISAVYLNAKLADTYQLSNCYCII